MMNQRGFAFCVISRIYLSWRRYRWIPNWPKYTQKQTPTPAAKRARRRMIQGNRFFLLRCGIRLSDRVPGACLGEKHRGSVVPLVLPVDKPSGFVWVTLFSLSF